MRAILINPVSRTVTEIDVTSGLNSECGLYIYAVVRIPVEVEADSHEAAIKLTDQHDFNRYLRDGAESAEQVTGYMVDPLLPDGTVDYRNAASFKHNGERE